jgi:hypothetical protein
MQQPHLLAVMQLRVCGWLCMAIAPTILQWAGAGLHTAAYYAGNSSWSPRYFCLCSGVGCGTHTVGVGAVCYLASRRDAGFVGRQTQGCTPQQLACR